MVSIYKITNDVNDIVYVGKTRHTLKKRYGWHKEDAPKAAFRNRKLYTAMREIGIDHFSISQIEECEDDVGAQREMYWVDKYRNTCGVYNETLGGDGNQHFNHEDILKALANNPFCSDIAKEFGCSSRTVRNVAKKNGIKVKNKSRELFRAYAIPVSQYDKNDKYIQSFGSMTEAFLWCCNNGCAKSDHKGGGISHISDTAKGKRKTAYGYQWRYANSD